MAHAKTEIILDDMENNPRCPHGPTVKFVDSVNGKTKQFFACSAFRDKKYCNFYLEKSSKITQGKRFKWRVEEKKFLSGKDHGVKYKYCQQFRDSAASEGHFCQTCELICSASLHQTHKLTRFKPDQLETAPSTILEARSTNKKEAQYFFTADSIEFLTSCIESSGVSHVLCVGAPTIYSNLSGVVKKLLLDFDSRYMGLLSPEEFVWFNMLNFHFFHGESAVFNSFLLSSNSNLAIVMDPPFGARPELVLNTLNNINSLLKNFAGSGKFVQPKLFWIFPYWMEKKLKELNLNLGMCDYRVSYTNHKDFSGLDGGRKHGSPVRLFTNLKLSLLPLPKCNQYKHCAECGFFVSNTNSHCDLCQACTSKDGRPYVHCQLCTRCVKETYVHCEPCDRCHLPGVKCKSDKQTPLQPAANNNLPTKRPASSEKSASPTVKRKRLGGGFAQKAGGTDSNGMGSNKRKQKSKKGNKKRKKFY